MTTSPPFTRRQLLRGGALYSLGSTLPALMLAACGGGSDSDAVRSMPPAQSTAPRESKTLHFDLSYADIAEPKLQMPGSTSHGARLISHTPESRTIHRQRNSALAKVSDANLTHYLEGIDAPASALQLGTIVGKRTQTGTPVLAMNFIHVPSTSMAKVASERVVSPLLNRQPTSKLQAQATLAVVPPPVADAHSAPRAIATALIFQHPGITNLNPDLGADIIDRIATLPSATAPYASTLIYQIAVLLEKGYPTTTDMGTWATLIARKDPTTGLPMLDDQGEQIYSYRMNPALAPTVAAVVKQILNSINSDTKFQGTNWQPSVGAPQQAATPEALLRGPLRRGQAAAAASMFSVNASVTPGSRTSGIRFKSINCVDDRSVGLTVANEFLRSAGVFVEYRDASGTTLPVDNPDSMDTSRSKYLQLLSPDVQIMGVPFLGDATPTTDINFTMPPAASQAILYYGGLGLGGSDAFHGEALLGSIATLVVNIGLPAICLTFGVYEDLRQGLSKGFQEALKDATIAKVIIKGVAEALGGGLGSSIQTATTTLSLNAFLAGIADTVIDIFFAACPLLSAKLAAAITISAAQKAIPIVGQVLWLASTVADVVAIGESIIECVSCPAIDTTTISLSMSQSVSIQRDPNNYQFPATATRYTVSTTYDGAKAPHSVSATIAAGTTGPLVVDLGKVASGGNVYAEVSFFNSQNCLVGYGKSQTLVNLPASASTVPLTITEILAPLDATTTYQHSSKLVYRAGAHAWDAGAAAPTSTVLSLSPGADNALGALNGITVHTPTGMAGYAFAAGGQGIPLCGGTSVTSVHSLRNVFLGNGPDSAAKFSSCGASQPMGIVYDVHSAITGGNSFFLQPGSDSFYHLRGVNLDQSNFDMAQTLSWGRFSNPLDSMCVLSNGFVLGVNRDTHKMEILRLPQQPSVSTDESDTTPFSALKSGWGSQQGQLDTPVAVCAFKANALVLEQGNRRVQAFDQDGTAVNLFTGVDGTPNSTALMQLRDGNDPTIVYLDIGVEGQGYIYVLSYANGGGSAASYHLDIYMPSGAWLSRTSGVAAGALAVDLFRNVYTLNYETVAGAPVIEPSVSQWIPQSTTPCVPSNGSSKTLQASKTTPLDTCQRTAA